MRREESEVSEDAAAIARRSPVDILATVPEHCDTGDGAVEREQPEAEIAHIGRMASIVVIREHDKAKNDAASPREAQSPEDVREELLPPLLTFNASSQQLV
jgi:hypothetical protein